MNYWVLFGFVWIGAAVYQHYHLCATRDEIISSIQQSIAIGRTDLFIKTREYDYRRWWSLSWRFPAEVIFAENGIYIFRYIGLFGRTKIFVKYHCLYATEQDILPFLKSRVNHFNFIHHLDLLKVDRRQVTLEFEMNVPWANMRFRHYCFVLEDVRDNDANRNLMRFQRYRHDILQQQRMTNG
mgnify:CR=1 FL=1